MKILLTGASGLLGSAIAHVAGLHGWQCHALSRDPQELAALAGRLSAYDVLIHAAANTNVEQCEIDPDRCYQDNWLLTELLAQKAAQAGVRMVFISSTGIYGIAKTAPYKEYDPVTPTTHHHTSKYLAEQTVLRQHRNNLVIRTGWLFGGEYANPKNFVARRVDEARNAQAANQSLIRSNAEQRGVPCYNLDIAERILLLVQKNQYGVFNCVNAGHASRCEYVKKIIELAGIPVDVEPSDAASFNRKARVSNNEMAENWKMAALGMPAMPAWEESLARYIAELQGKQK